MHPQLVALLLCSLQVVRAFDLNAQWPAWAPKSIEQQPLFPAPSESVRRVAVIGAGAGGSSAAFWLGRAKERYGLDVEVDVYEKADYVGGRSTTVQPYNDKALTPVELGASVFVRVNKNIWRATDEFNLTRTDFRDEDADVGIWDGENFALTIRDGNMLTKWWQTAKVLWRYGLNAPRRANGLVASMLTSYVRLYSPLSPVWDTIESLSVALGFQMHVAQSTDDYFTAQGVSAQFTREMVEAATRVNYGHNVEDIHALEGACSMAADKASSVVGGNFQVFEHMIAASGARLALKTEIKSISRKAGDPSWTVSTSDGRSSDYEAVILAAPYHQTGIALSSPIFNTTSLADKLPPQPYVHLHVTLLATSNPHPRASYFGMGPEDVVPTMILTTYEGARNGGKVPEFNSLSYHGQIRYANGTARDTKEWIVKIFSERKISDAWLADMFEGQVGWVLRKEWDAYPRLPPTVKFPSIKLDRGLYYVNAFEPFISTMETETIASRNVVDTLLHDHFGSGICGPRDAERVSTVDVGSDFVLGWDC